MNDTHGVEGKGWYGFDLDGTLAKYDGWKGIDHIGEPVKPMVDLVKRLHADGRKIKILTARVAPRLDEEGNLVEQSIIVDPGIQGPRRTFARDFIRNWCVDNLGFIPEITHEKDHLMLELYDDRVKQVVPNEGWLVEDIAMSKRQIRETTITKLEPVDLRWWGRISWFFFGMGAAALLVMLLGAFVRPNRDTAERKLRDALTEYMNAGAGPLGIGGVK